MTEKDLVEARDRLQEIHAAQEKLREEELQIRNYVVERSWPEDKQEGAVTLTVGAIKMTLEKKFNRRISKEDAELLKQKHPKLYAEALNWTPNVRNGVYKDNVEVMDKFIVTTAAPSIVVFK